MTAADPIYCARCGEDLTGGHTGRAGESLEIQHAKCSRALLLEPPRYCPQCRRRMVVQVTPVGWSATFGFYTPTLRTTDLIPGQVRLLRSLVAGREATVGTILLADDLHGVYAPKAAP